MRYVHTNIIAHDWQKLAEFYIHVFECVPKPPVRNQAGEWLAQGTGVPNAHLFGMHLRLPGYDEHGPTLEIYQYHEVIAERQKRPNSQGYGHLAFQVDHIAPVLEKACQHGAQKCGAVSEKRIEGLGLIRFIYIYDPEGNLIELQSWED